MKTDTGTVNGSYIPYPSHTSPVHYTCTALQQKHWISHIVHNNKEQTVHSKAYGHLKRSLVDITVVSWIPLTCLQAKIVLYIYNQVKQECSEVTIPCIPRLSQDPLLAKKQQSVQHTVQYSGDTFTDDVQFLFCRMHIPTFVIAA